MKEKHIGKFQLLFIYLRKNNKIKNQIIALAYLPLVYLLVYYTGGSKFVYSHTMYIPIVFAGLLIGSKFGIVAGIIGGLLLGPLMPLDTVTGETQLFFNWFYRLLMFTVIGALSGVASDTLQRNIDANINLLSHNHDTDIPNANYLQTLSKKRFDLKKQSVFSVLVTNYENIIDVLGSDIYYRSLKDLYLNLKNNLPADSIIVQSDSNKLWIAILGDDLQKDVNHLLKLLSGQPDIGDVPVYMELAVGAFTAETKKECLDANTYKHSDLAARFAQKNNVPYSVYDENINYSEYNYELLGELSEALKQDQTFLSYQPKIDLATNKIIGLEALIRWKHPTRGLIPPDRFIPMVEETQLIQQLTEWVLKKALLKIKEFKEAGIDVRISVNISVRNLQFINRIVDIVRQQNISPKQIEFEIVESVLMYNPDEYIHLLSRLRDEGFTLSIDDFGKGYSSLAYLCQFPVQIIKIDQTFIRQIEEDEPSQHIVSSTIELAHKLGIKVVAEGVETEKIAEITRLFNCDYAQGYYFARPIKDDEIIDWYKNNNQ